MKYSVKKSLKFSLITLIATFLLVPLLTSCVANAPFRSETPKQTSYVYTDSYDRVWGVVSNVLLTDGFSLEVIDKSSGIMSGVKRLDPTTMDMLMNYSARIAASVSVQRTSGGVLVQINSTNERKHEEHDWRPAGAADNYSAMLFESINQQLSLSYSNNSSRQRSTPITSSSVSQRAPASSLSPERQEVQRVQTMLNDLGYSAGVEDGIMGRNTSSAIRSFQKDNELEITGELDDQTIQALKDAWLKL